MSYNVGIRVYWYSQGGGNLKRKEGLILEAVPAGFWPKTALSKHVAGRKSGTRNHESYVVLADNGEKYWPIASKLNAFIATV